MIRALLVGLVLLLVVTFPATWLLMLFLGNIGTNVSYWGALPLGILASRERVFQIIRDEFKRMKDEFNTPRKTTLEEADATIEDEEALIQHEDMVLTITHQGYVKRVRVDIGSVVQPGQVLAEVVPHDRIVFTSFVDMPATELRDRRQRRPARRSPGAV